MKKHMLKMKDIVCAILKNEPIFMNTKFKRTMIIAHYLKYITIFYEEKQDHIEIITAYPSSKWQKKLYRKNLKK